jgi:hypothetical protein
VANAEDATSLLAWLQSTGSGQRCGFAEWQQPFDAIEPRKALFCSYHPDVFE